MAFEEKTLINAATPHRKHQEIDELLIALHMLYEFRAEHQHRIVAESKKVFLDALAQYPEITRKLQEKQEEVKVVQNAIAQNIELQLTRRIEHIHDKLKNPLCPLMVKKLGDTVIELKAEAYQSVADSAKTIGFELGPMPTVSGANAVTNPLLTSSTLSPAMQSFANAILNGGASSTPMCAHRALEGVQQAQGLIEGSDQTETSMALTRRT